MSLRFPFSETAIVAHRGAHCCGREENSLPAIQHALDLDVRGIETDVCNLADGELVLSHNPYVTLDGLAIPLTALTLPELLSLPVCKGVVRAAEAMELFRTSGAFLCLDWKGLGDEQQLVHLIDDFRLGARTIVCSHQPDSLLRIKEGSRGLLTGLSVRGGERVGGEASAGRRIGEIATRLRAVGADAAMLELGLASPALLGALRSGGTGVFVWTAKDPETRHILTGLAPDGIMADVLEEHTDL